MSKQLEKAPATPARHPEREAVLRLIRGVQAGSETAKTALLRQYERACWQAARRWKGTTELEDAFQGACMGLLEAAVRFDETTNVRFFTYASFRMRAGVRDERRRELGDAGPRRLNVVLPALHHAAETRGLSGPAAVLADDALVEELAPTLRCSPELLRSFRVILQPPAREEPTSDDPDALAPTLFVTDETPEDLAIAADEVVWARERLAALLPTLSSQERLVIERRWLSDEDERPSLRALGQEIGCSGQNVSIIEARALGRLRRAAHQSPDKPRVQRASPDTRLRARDHQERALVALEQGLRSHDRGQLISACGTGKTLTALWLRERLEARRVAVFAPSLGLVAQTLRVWARNARTPWLSIAVCSDDTVSDPAIWAESLAEMGIEATTDPRKLRLELLAAGGQPLVVFSTYQSSRVLAEALAPKDDAPTPDPFDLMVLDEAHRTATVGLTDFSRPLHNTEIPARKRLAMTATPRVFTVRGDRDDVSFSSMDDEASYGPVLHQMTFAEAIAEEILSDFRVAIVGVESADAVVPTGRVALGKEVLLPVEEAVAVVAATRAVKDYGCRRLLSFHNRVARAKSFADAFARVGPALTGVATTSCHVTGEMSARVRAVALATLETRDPGVAAVASARCLAEGVDAPAVDCVVFADPKQSPEAIAQAIGRALRRNENGAFSTVILPVLVHPGEDDLQTLDSSAYRVIWRVLNALQAHDSTLRDQLDSARRALGTRSVAGDDKDAGQWLLPDRVLLALPETVSVDFVQALRLRIVRETTSRWEECYAALLEVPLHHGLPQDESLSAWCRMIRQYHAQGMLVPKWVERLAAVPGWEWTPRESKFQAGVATFRAFVETHGHGLVSAEYRTPDGFPLGAWVTTRRGQRQKGTLPTKHRTVLEALPGWTWAVKADVFADHLADFEHFVREQGHGLVPQRYITEGGFQLGAWVNTVRTRRRKGQLEPERIALLEATPGWIWEPKAAAFQQGMEALRAFCQEHGHARVTRGHIANGLRLGQWVHGLRSGRRQGWLRPEQVAALEALPGWTWSVWDAMFEDGLAELRAYIAATGSARVPTAYIAPSGYKLGSWTNTQRSYYRKGKLSDAQIAALAALPDWTWGDQRARRGEPYPTPAGDEATP